MEPRQQRVVEERNELEEKLDRLSQVLDSPVHVAPDEVNRLVIQENIMRAYVAVLGARIAAF